MYDEASQITHAGKQVHVAAIVRDGAGCPQVDMQNKKRAGDGPGEDKLLVLPGLLVGKDTVGAQEEMSLRIFGQRNRRRKRCSVLNSFMWPVTGLAW